MDFAAMKRRELQALCKRHGLAGGGTNAALVARLTAALSGSGGAAKEAVRVVVGKGCMKRSPAGASGGDLDAAKKVTFELEEDDDEATEEVGVTVTRRARRRSQVLTSPAVAKTRGGQKHKTGEVPPAAKGMRRRTRSQAGGDSADEIDSGEAGADAPVRRSGRSAVNLGAAHGAERVTGEVTHKNSAKAEQQEPDIGAAVGRKNQLKRKAREDDIEDADVSGQVGVARRSTRSSGLLLEPEASSPSVEKKRGRRKAADLKEKTCVEEPPTKALQSGRTLRSGVVLVAPVPPIVSESKESRGKVQEEEPAAEKVVKVEISGRTTRSSSVAPVPPIVAESKKSKGKVHKEELAAEKVAKAEISGRTTRSSSVAPVLPIVAESKKSRGKVHEEEPAVEKVAQAEISGRTTRSSSIAPVPPIVSESKKSRGKVHEEEPAVEKVSKAEISGRTTRSSSIAPVPPIVSESKKSRGEVQEEEPAVEKGVVKAEIVGRTTRSSSVAPAMASPRVIKKKRGRKTDNVQSDGGLDEKRENKRQSSRLTTRGSIHHLAPSGDEASLEEVAAPSRGLPLRRSKRNPSEANMMLNSSTTSESSNYSRASTEFNGPKIRCPTMLNGAKDCEEDDVEKLDQHLESKKSKLRNVGATEARNSGEIPFSESSGKASATDMQIKVSGPVRRSTHVKRPMLEKGRKSISTEIIPEAHVKRPMRKPTLPMVNSENNDHCVVVNTENLQSNKCEEFEKQPTVKQPFKRLTQKSAAPTLLEIDRKGVPAILNNENSDRTEMQSDKIGHLEKQLVVKEPVSGSTGKSVVPDVNESVRSEEPSVKTRSARTGLHVALQNDESLQRTTLKSSKLAISPSQSKPTASKGRPAKRRRTLSLQEDMPSEEQKEDQIAYETHTNDVIEVATSTPLEIGVLPFAAEKSDLQDSQLNSELEGAVRDEDDRDILEIEMDSTVGTTEKPPSNLPFPDSKDVGTISAEVVCSIENDAGRCSPNFGQSPTGPQFLFLQGISEKSATHNAIPCPENCVEESDVHKVKCQVETVVPSKFESYHGSDENSVRVEESGGFTFSSQQNNEQEGSSVLSCSKDLVAYAQLDLSEDVDNVVRDVIAEDLGSKEEEKNDLIPSSDINVLHQISHANEPAKNASGVSGSVICISQSTPISDEVNSDSLRLEAHDASYNCITSSNTEAVQQDNEDKNSLQNEVTHSIHVSVISEAAHVEVSKSEKMLLPDVQTSVFRAAQLNSKREGNEFEEHIFSCGKDGSGKNNMFQLVNEYGMDSCQDQELKLPHDISAFKSPKGSTTCQDEFVVGSGIGPNIGSNIASDAPGTAKQGYNLSSSETASLRNRENTPACKIDAPELSSDHLFPMDSSARAVQSLSGRLREAGLAVGNSDNKLRMEQVQQDDVQVLEGTLENTAQDSATLESNHQCGLSEEAEPHSLKKICSSSVEQSKIVPQSLLLQDDVHKQDGTQENAAPGSVTPECKQKCGVPDEEDQHPLNNERCSTSVEQSPFGLPLLFSQERIEEPSEIMRDIQQDGTQENAAPGLVTPECKQKCGVPDEEDQHPLNIERCSTSVEQSPFGLPLLFSQERIEEPSEIMRDIQQDDTQENASPGSVTPECKQNCGVPDEEDQHPLNNERCSTSVEQSPFCLPLLFSQERIEEPSENVALAIHAKNVVDESKDIHVGYKVEKAPVPESVSDHDSSVDFSTVYKSDDCAYTCDQGLTKSIHEQEQMACQPNLLEAANCMEDFTNKPDKENNKPVHSTDLSSSCEKIDANRPVKHASLLGDGLLSSSLIASTDDTDVHPSSYPYQFESTDILDELKGCSSTEALQQGLKEQCQTPKESQVTYQAYPSDMIEASTAKDFESEVQPLPAEETSDMLLEYLSLGESSKVSDMLGDFVLPSAENVDEQLIEPLLAAETSDLLDEQANPKLEVGESEKCKYSSEDTSGKIGTGSVEDTIVQLHEDLHMDPIQGKELPNELPAPKSPEQSTAGQDAETSAFPGYQPNLESEKCNFSSEDTGGKNGTGYVKNTLFQYPIQGKELLDDLPAPKSPEQSTAGQDEEASDSLDDQPNPESEKCNFSSDNTGGKNGTGYVKNTLFQYPIQEEELPDDLPAPKSPEQSAAVQDAKTLALPDEQPKPQLKGGELKEHKISSEDRSGGELHEDSHMGPNPGKELPDNLPAPKSPEQSTAGQDAETLASPDELPSPELDSSEFVERNLSSEDTSSIVGTGYGETNLFQIHEDSNQGKELPDNVPAPKSPGESASGQDAETSAWSDEQLNPKLEVGEFGEHSFSSEDTSGQNAETSAWSGEQVNPKLDAGEFVERNFSSEDMHEYSLTDPILGKELPDYLPADKSPKQSTIGYGENASGDDEKFDPELEVEFSDEHNDDQTTAAVLSSGMTKPTLVEGYVSGMALLSAAGTPASTEEQPNSKLEGYEEHNSCFDADNNYISDTGLMENDNLLGLPEDFFGHELPVGTPATKSSGESVVFRDNSVPGSVGTCQTSRRRRIEEISTKLLSFKISSAVKGSYIALESAKTKQGDNPRPISLLRDMENVPAANPDHPAELNTDLLDVKDSPRQGTSDGL